MDYNIKGGVLLNNTNSTLRKAQNTLLLQFNLFCYFHKPSNWNYCVCVCLCVWVEGGGAVCAADLIGSCKAPEYCGVK